MRILRGNVRFHKVCPLRDRKIRCGSHRSGGRPQWLEPLLPLDYNPLALEVGTVESTVVGPEGCKLAIVSQIPKGTRVQKLPLIC